MSKNSDYSKIDEIVSLYRPAPINSHPKSAYNIDINRYRYRYVYVVIINSWHMKSSNLAEAKYQLAKLRYNDVITT